MQPGIDPAMRSPLRRAIASYLPSLYGASLMRMRSLVTTDGKTPYQVGGADY